MNGMLLVKFLNFLLHFMLWQENTVPTKFSLIDKSIYMRIKFRFDSSAARDLLTLDFGFNMNYVEMFL